MVLEMGVNMRTFFKRLLILSLVCSLALVPITITDAYADSYDYEYEDDDLPDTSGTYLEKTNITLCRGYNYTSSVNVRLMNCPSLYSCEFDYSCSNPDMEVECYINSEEKYISIYATNPGSCVITFTLNDHKMYLNLKVVRVKMNKTSLLLVKKKKATLKVKGCDTCMGWTSSNPKVATVDSRGVVKGKKIGNAIIYATSGQCKLGCVVSVVQKKIKKAYDKSQKICKGKYSQPLRMKKGYYDCSSLVWRSFKSAKIKLVTKYYAPVAADIAKYYVKKKKRKIKGKPIKNFNKMKLRVGDLYFCTGSKNKRYKGIYHVEMFVGYEFGGFDFEGKPIIYPKWACRYQNLDTKHCLMVRPYKG